jgi:NAD(P) transhydrogenase subunit alpha
MESGKQIVVTLGIPREITTNERRVAGTPETVKKLIKLGFAVIVEQGAGKAANFSDQAYEHAGAKIVADAAALWSGSDVVIKVQPPVVLGGRHELDLLKPGATLVSFIWPVRNKALLDQCVGRNVNILAMDAVPRISRAQKLDALSSMANIAGYRAVIEAAGQFGSFFTGQITAAGKVPPAKIMVIGAGVAGLAAIGAARGLGAVVRAFDTRPEVKEQVKSMGAEFLELDFKEEGSGVGGYAKVMSPEFIKAEMELFAKQAKEVDIIITTALVPGTKAPVLITADMVRSMKPGSVIVDLAAEQGGNCELTRPGEVHHEHGVALVGYTDLPSRMPAQASQLFGNNIVNLLTDMVKDGAFRIDMNDEVIRGTTVVHQGQLTWPPPRPAQPAPAPQAAAKPAASMPAGPAKKSPLPSVFAAVACVLLFLLGRAAPSEFLGHLTVFVLACFVGWQVVWNVTPALHTPLMSVTNAISGIIVIGAMLQVGGDMFDLKTILAAVAVLIATINVAGGFLVTQRMLTMFRK